MSRAPVLVVNRAAYQLDLIAAVALVPPVEAVLVFMDSEDPRDERARLRDFAVAHPSLFRPVDDLQCGCSRRRASRDAASVDALAVEVSSEGVPMLRMQDRMRRPRRDPDHHPPSVRRLGPRGFRAPRAYDSSGSAPWSCGWGRGLRHPAC